jgi:hypothetical protein
MKIIIKTLPEKNVKVFSGTPSSSAKTYHYDITEILLKVALNSTTLPSIQKLFSLIKFDFCN